MLWNIHELTRKSLIELAILVLLRASSRDGLLPSPPGPALMTRGLCTKHNH